MVTVYFKKALLMLLALTMMGVCLGGCSAPGDTLGDTTDGLSEEPATANPDTDPVQSASAQTEPASEPQTDAPQTNAPETDAPETDAPQIDAPETSPVIKNTGIDGLDFLLKIPEGREPRILQITDTQMIRFSGIRNLGGRYDQVKGEFFVEGDERSKDDDIRTWRYVEEGIQRGNPDLIVFTGDNIYGETDDDGSLWTDFCSRMDSYGIPWAVVWGNHDNESGKGVRWQIEMVEKSKFGIIKQNNTDTANGKGGNSNYTLGIKQGSEIRYVLYFLDTNGCKVKTNLGESMLANNPDIDIIRQTGDLDASQVAWINSSYATITAVMSEEIPTMWFMHIPPEEAFEAFKSAYPDSYNVSPFEPDQNGDQGSSTEGLSGFGFATDGVAEAIASTNCTGIFLGHLHRNSASVAWNGVRYTFGLKTGTYDYFDYSGKMLGTLLIRIDEQSSDFEIDYQYTELALVDVNGPGHRVG